MDMYVLLSRGLMHILFCNDGISRKENSVPGENWEAIYDIVWIEGNIYSIELGDKLGIGVIDADGNMQVTAENEELKPYEGYYQITYVDDYLREMYNN